MAALGETSNTLCSISHAAAVVADRPTVLILRELALGVRRFDEIQSQTALPPSLLSNRLKTLRARGIIERRPYQLRPPRHEYHVTAKGRDLDAVLLSLRAWGSRWSEVADAPPAIQLTHKETGRSLEGALPDGEHLTDYDIVLSPAFAEERRLRQTSSGFGKSQGSHPRSSARAAAPDT